MVKTGDWRGVEGVWDKDRIYINRPQSEDSGAVSGSKSDLLSIYTGEVFWEGGEVEETPL